MSLRKIGLPRGEASTPWNTVRGTEPPDSTVNTTGRPDHGTVLTETSLLDDNDAAGVGKADDAATLLPLLLGVGCGFVCCETMMLLFWAMMVVKGTSSSVLMSMYTPPWMYRMAYRNTSDRCGPSNS